jgi:hypothetical protein
MQKVELRGGSKMFATIRRYEGVVALTSLQWQSKNNSFRPLRSYRVSFRMRSSTPARIP